MGSSLLYAVYLGWRLGLCAGCCSPQKNTLQTTSLFFNFLQVGFLGKSAGYSRPLPTLLRNRRGWGGLLFCLSFDRSSGVCASANILLLAERFDAMKIKWSIGVITVSYTHLTLPTSDLV